MRSPQTPMDCNRSANNQKALEGKDNSRPWHTAVIFLCNPNQTASPLNVFWLQQWGTQDANSY